MELIAIVSGLYLFQQFKEAVLLGKLFKGRFRIEGFAMLFGVVAVK
jgi:hypothetical protein